MIEGINLSPCTRLVILHLSEECSANSSDEFLRLMKSSSEIIGNRGGRTVGPIVIADEHRSENYSASLYFADVRAEKPGTYKICLVQWAPGSLVQTSEMRQQQLNGGLTAEFNAFILGAAESGTLQVLDEKELRELKDIERNLKASLT